MAREPELHRWKLAPKKQPRPLSLAEPLEIPDAPEAPPAVEPPGDLAPVPLLYPFGPTPFAYLHSLLETLDSGALAVAGDTMTGTLEISSGANPELNLQDRYQLYTDNVGTPGHTASGPNLKIKDIAKNHEPLRLLSIGQLQINIKDASLANNTVSHGLQIRRSPLTAGAAALGFGTGIQIFMPGTDDSEVEVGNIQFELTSVTPGAVGSGIRFRVRLSGTNTEVLRSTSVGNLLTPFKMLATGGLGAGNSVAATTLASPGTTVRRMEVFDASGNSLGSVPVYSNGSFS